MKISSIARINFSIISMCVAAIVFAAAIGFVPDERVYRSEIRSKLSESVATNVSYLIASHDVRQAGQQLATFAAQNEDLISIGLRRSEGEYVAHVGNHTSVWEDAIRHQSDGCYVVPIHLSDGEWGSLEIQFSALYSGTNQWLSGSLLTLLAIVVLLVGTACWLHLRHMLRYLDPSRSVPMRVRQALDIFAEGVLVLDRDHRIVLVNKKFAGDVKRDQEDLLGTKLWDIPWQTSEIENADSTESGIDTYQGTRMKLLDDCGQVKMVFAVNSSPVHDDAGTYQGLMMAFTDVTPLERSRAALLNTLEDLSESKLAITQQNEELTYLATRDPLTSCINRRTFFEQFEKHWEAAKTRGVPLGAIMIDIDFFKSINDDHGHGMGDDVLRKTGRLLQDLSREEDVVCRYGGEEFAILMPGLSVDDVEVAAERIRVGMSELEFPEFSITASLGVSEFNLGGNDPQDMLNQADKCLYVAKRNGRDQVVRFDTVPKDLIVDESKISRVKPTETQPADGPSIPYSAVNALFAALTYRDHQTGAHCMRVSSLAALLAQRILRPKEVYVVEIAALLHDIGKVGVPDAILLKPDVLSDEEWNIMEKHDRIGVEILNKSFKHSGMTDIIKCHHYQFDGVKSEKQDVKGKDIPVGARILTIVDAFDAMVNNRPYRDGFPISKAIDELRANAGSQFDPELVETFVDIIQSGDFESNMVSDVSFEDEVALCIGEQVERLVEAADSGDRKTFVALAERLRVTAEQRNVSFIASAAANAAEASSEDETLDILVKESFELLAACRAMRNSMHEAPEELVNHDHE
ncbi:MAG: diguanylate cyclase [Planctomycetota bacterium]